MAFCGKCNISLASHRDFEPYPASAKMPRGFSSLFAQKNFDYKIARDFSAQNDRLIDYFALLVCYQRKATKVFLIKLFTNYVFCGKITMLHEVNIAD